MKPYRLPVLALTLALSACMTSGPKRSGSGPYAMKEDRPPAAAEIPPNIEKTPDAVPREEPKSRSGNPDNYRVFGKTYKVLKSVEEGYSEKGKASYYGKKFHGHKTASGEIYDMFTMTAAHKHLPLPTYVRVTRTDNGKSCIVRVNDRGPFHPGRIIDLSYAAAARIDMVIAGEVPVEIEVITSAEAANPEVIPVPKPEREPEKQVFRSGYWVIGSYDDPIDAATLKEELVSLEVGPVSIAAVQNQMVVRVGPFSEQADAQLAADRIRARGLPADWATTID